MEKTFSCIQIQNAANFLGNIDLFSLCFKIPINVTYIQRQYKSFKSQRSVPDWLKLDCFKVIISKMVFFVYCQRIFKCIKGKVEMVSPINLRIYKNRFKCLDYHRQWRLHSPTKIRKHNQVDDIVPLSGNQLQLKKQPLGTYLVQYLRISSHPQ